MGQYALVAGQQPEGRADGSAVMITGRWARVRASFVSLLVLGSNTVRTCVQGFVAFRSAYKSVTCGDGDLRVQEHRSAAERGFRGGGASAGLGHQTALPDRDLRELPVHIQPDTPSRRE